MMDELKPLECSECPVSKTDQMCAAVIISSLRKVAELGYDTHSDSRPSQQFLFSLGNSDARVEDILEDECIKRQGHEISMQRGYSQVVY